jgi:glycine/D-amino acid oxidase-like deaminating enzyme
VEVCVVGAGIIGAVTAYQLSRRGARVTVLDATLEPCGASAATFGWVNANAKQPEHYFELNRDGMEAYEDLRHALGEGSWLHGGGSVEWAGPDGGGALRARVEADGARGYPAEMIDAARLRELEPELAPGAAPTEAAFFPSEGTVDAVQLIGLLLAAAQGMGAVVRRGVRVEHLDVSRDGRAVVALDPSETITADVVVNCAGADAGTLAAQTGLMVETAGPLGLNAVTAPVSVSLGRVVRAPGVHFRPERGGRIMIASPSADAALAGGADTAGLAERLVDAAARHLPGIVGAAVEEARAARRAIPPDGLPIVGRLADAPWLYHLVTHSGVTLAPLLGSLAAEEILGGADDARLAPYRPARFKTSVSS